MKGSIFQCCWILASMRTLFAQDIDKRISLLHHSLQNSIGRSCEYHLLNDSRELLSILFRQYYQPSTFLVLPQEPAPDEIFDYVNLPPSVSRVNQQLALGMVKGKPYAIAWAKHPARPPLHDDHPRRNKSNCVRISQLAYAHPLLVYEDKAQWLHPFYLVYAQHVLIHEQGILSTSCGSFNPYENCESLYSRNAPHRHKDCLEPLRHSSQHSAWSELTSPQSILLQHNRSSSFCHHVKQGAWSYFPAVFVLTALWDHNYHHFLIDSMIRLIRSLDFLQSHPEIKIHIRAFERTRLDDPQGLYGHQITGPIIRRNLWSLIGIDESRIIWGNVIAKEVYLPRAIKCGNAISHALEVRLLSKHLLTAARESLRKKVEPTQSLQHYLQAHSPFVIQYHPSQVIVDNYTIKPIPSNNNTLFKHTRDEYSTPLISNGILYPKKIIVQIRDCKANQSKRDTYYGWSCFTPPQSLQLLHTLSKQFPFSQIVSISGQNASTANCVACEMMDYHEGDILIGFHGAGNTNVMFLKPNSLFVEITGVYDGRMLPMCGYYGAFASMFAVHHYVNHYDWHDEQVVNITDLVTVVFQYYQELHPIGDGLLKQQLDSTDDVIQQDIPKTWKHLREF